MSLQRASREYKWAKFALGGLQPGHLFEAPVASGQRERQTHWKNVVSPFAQEADNPM